MYLPKHDNIDRYTLISKDTGNGRTRSFLNDISLDNTYAQRKR